MLYFEEFTSIGMICFASFDLQCPFPLQEKAN